MTLGATSRNLIDRRAHSIGSAPLQVFGSFAGSLAARAGAHESAWSSPWLEGRLDFESSKKSSHQAAEPPTQAQQPQTEMFSMPR